MAQRKDVVLGDMVTQQAVEHLAQRNVAKLKLDVPLDYVRVALKSSKLRDLFQRHK